MEELSNASPFNYTREFIQHQTLNDGRDNTCNFPLDEMTNNIVQEEPSSMAILLEQRSLVL